MIVVSKQCIGTDRGLISPRKLEPGFIVYSYAKNVWIPNILLDIEEAGFINVLQIKTSNPIIGTIHVPNMVSVRLHGRLLLLDKERLNDRMRIGIVYGFPVLFEIARTIRSRIGKLYLGLVNLHNKNMHHRLLLDRTRKYHKVVPKFGTVRIKEFKWCKMLAYNLILEYDLPTVVNLTLQF